MAAAIKAEFATLKATKPNPQIFWGFIERERNSILNVYEFGAKQNVGITLPRLVLDRKTGRSWSEGGGVPATYEHVMAGGPFAGLDPRDVVKQAIDWWYSYLDRIDQRGV